MFFPLLSTLKLAVLLQQQIPTATSTISLQLPADRPTAKSIAGGAEEEKRSQEAKGPEEANSAGIRSADESTTVPMPLPISTIVSSPLPNGCWTLRDRADNTLRHNNGIRMECCAPPANPQLSASPSKSQQLPPLPSTTSSNSFALSPTKCRLKIDFCRLWVCNQQMADRVECFREFGENAANFGGAATEFAVSIGKMSGDPLPTSELFNALRPLNVTSLELELLPAEEDKGTATGKVQMPNLGLFFHRLQHFSAHSWEPNAGRRPTLLGRTFLRDLPMLRSLKIVNADFELDSKEEPQWVGQLESLHAENASVESGDGDGDGDLPRWLAKCNRLERVLFRNCALNSSLVLSQLPSAVHIKVSESRLADVHRVVFKCSRLRELYLRGNRISRIAPHTFAHCTSLRLLDLSDNQFGARMPDKVFLGCQRLKQLRLERIGLMFLRPELFLGLSNLKSMSLAGNPLSPARIDPFTFLPTPSIQALSLANCSLTSIPLALTQCCLLDSLVLDDNRLATRQSMPPEVMALLSRLSRLSFQRNPLLQLPHGLFLYEPDGGRQERKLADILNTLVHLPVWRLEPCTPYFWHLHLRNASSLELRRRMAVWNEERMAREGLGHCRQLYETIVEGIDVYRELLENSGCEATRRLRSVRAKENCPVPMKWRNNGDRREVQSGKRISQKTTADSSALAPVGIIRFMLAPAGILAQENANANIPGDPPGSNKPTRNSVPVRKTFTSSFGLLHLSLGANFCLFSAVLLLAMWKIGGKISSTINSRVGSRRGCPKRSEFEEIC